MTRVQLVRELDARALKEGSSEGIVPGVGGVAIQRFTYSAGRKAGKHRRYYFLNGAQTSRTKLVRKARALDAKDGLQELLQKCLRESAIEELRMRREATHG